LVTARTLGLALLVLLSAQPFSSGMDAFATPWIANLTQEPVEFILTDSQNITGNFQLRPATILQYSVGPQEITAFSVTRASGQVQSYDRAALQTASLPLNRAQRLFTHFA